MVSSCRIFRVAAGSRVYWFNSAILAAVHDFLLARSEKQTRSHKSNF